MASASSDLVRTLSIRYLHDDEWVLRGPFHHSHIKDLLDVAQIPLSFEISSEANPDWVPCEQHPIYPIINPARKQFKLRQTEPEPDSTPEKTLSIRYIKDYEWVLRGPFHHSHIKDLLNVQQIPPSFEISSYEKPEWIPFEQHPAYSIINPAKTQFTLKEAVAPLKESSAPSALELVGETLSEEAKEELARMEKIHAHEALTSTKARREINTIIGFGLWMLIPIGWSIFMTGFLWSIGFPGASFCMSGITQYIPESFIRLIFLRDLGNVLGDQLALLSEPQFTSAWVIGTILGLFGFSSLHDKLRHKPHCWRYLLCYTLVWASTWPVTAGQAFSYIPFEIIFHMLSIFATFYFILYVSYRALICDD